MAKKNSKGYFEVKVVIGRNLDGSQKRKSFYSQKSIKDAKKKAEEYLVETKAKNLAGINEVTEITFEEWAKFWLYTYKQNKVKENTYSESYERPTIKILIPYFGNTLLTNITQADIEIFFKKQSQHYMESTLHKLRLCLNGIFESAIENNKCFKNPVKNVNYSVLLKGREKRAYSKTDVDIILNFAKNNMSKLPDGILIWIQIELGLRTEELLALDYSKFDLEKNTVTIDKAVVSIRGVPTLGDVKSKRSKRVLPISSELAKTLKNMPETGLIAGKLIDAARYNHGKYSTWFRAFQKEHNIEKYTPHELRHTRGTLLYKDTGDIYAVSRFLGHSSVSVTEKIYVHDDVEDLRGHLKIV